MPSASIYEFVKEQRESYRSNTINIADGYEFSQYETLRTIELYHSSKFLTGNKDSLSREKPFYNVTKFRVNVATRATDLDTKDVTIESDEPGAYVESFILNLKNRNWMKQSGFPTFLNRLGQTRAKYGGVIVKKTEQDGELKLHVVPWRDMITDQIDIRSGVKIERHYYTPAQLQKMTAAGWQNIDAAIETAKKSKQASATGLGKDNKTPGAYIQVYEVHGDLPTCYLAGTSDAYPQDYGSESEYAEQMHVVVLDESDDEKINGTTLYGGVEDGETYKYKEYEKVEGRALGVGVVEDLFEAQVWTNYNVQQKKDMLDLAGKIIFQTSDSSIAAKNILTDLENGALITTGPNGNITQVNNAPIALNGLAQLMSDWDTQAENVTSTYPAILGQTPPHGTAFRLQAGLVNEASALFEYRRQEAGLFIQEIYFDWVLPFLVKQIKNDKQLTATLEPEELEMVSEAIAQHEALVFAKKQVLSGVLVHQQDIDAIKEAARSNSMKLRRKGFKDFADLFDDWQGTVDVITTGEQKDKQALLSTLFQLFGTVATNPQLLQNPTMANIFNEIVEAAGASPLLQQTGQATPPQTTPPANTGTPPAPPTPTPSPLPANAVAA